MEVFGDGNMWTSVNVKVLLLVKTRQVSRVHVGALLNKRIKQNKTKRKNKKVREAQAPLCCQKGYEDRYILDVMYSTSRRLAVGILYSHGSPFLA